MKKCIIVFFIFVFFAGSTFAQDIDIDSEYPLASARVDTAEAQAILPQAPAAPAGKISFGVNAQIGTVILFPQGEYIEGPQWQSFYRPPPAQLYATHWDHQGPVYGFNELTVNYDYNAPNGLVHTEVTFRGALRGQNKICDCEPCRFHDGSLGYSNHYEGSGSVKWYSSYETDLYKIAMGLRSHDYSFTNFKDHTDFITHLYGYYFFWNKQIKFDIAYRGYDATFTDLFLGYDMYQNPKFKVDERSNYSEDLPLASNVVATWNLDMPTYDRLLPWWGNFANRDGMRLTYVPDYFEGGFIFRVAWRDLFTFTDVDLWWIEDQGSFQHSIEQYLETFTLFSRFDMKPKLEIPLVLSLGYANRAAKAFHFGAKYEITDKLNVSGDMMLTGLIDVEKYGIMAFGANIDFSFAPLYANMYFRFGLDISDSDYRHNGNFQIEPVIKFAIIRNTLLARIGVAYTTGIGEYYSQRHSFLINPGLYWNMKGDGDTEEPSSGIRIFYRFGEVTSFGTPADKTNDLYITFHWSL